MSGKKVARSRLMCRLTAFVAVADNYSMMRQLEERFEVRLLQH